MAFINLKNLFKTYNKGKSNEQKVLDNITLEFEKTGLYTIYGPSGCGKTTLLNTIGGLDKVDNGSIVIDSQNVNINTDYLRNKYIGFIFQNYYLNDNETVFDNVAFSLILKGVKDKNVIKEKVDKALDLVGLINYSRRYPNTLSGGQMQRVAIARAIVKDPEVILADEPTGNLDELNTIMIMDILKEISKSKLVILVTHEDNIVESYSDKIIKVEDGKVLSITDNYSTNGITSNKNVIYLKDLEHNELLNVYNTGISLNTYGSNLHTNITIINHNNKIYLKVDSSVNVITESSEVKIVNESAKDIIKHNEVKYNSLDFTTTSTSKMGVLFTLKSSLIKSIKTFNHLKSKGIKLLITILVLLAFVLVFNVATMGVAIKDYNDAIKNVDENMFFLPISEDIDYTDLMNDYQEHDIDYVSIISDSNLSNGTNLSFRIGNFVTANIPDIVVSGIFVTTDLLMYYPTIAGKSTLDNDYEIIISKSIAEKIIDSSNEQNGTLNDYSDLIGGKTSNNTQNSSITIVGIVDCNIDYYFVTDYMKTKEFIGNSNTISCIDDYPFFSGTLDKGYVFNLSNWIKQSQIMIQGKLYNTITIDSEETLFEYMNRIGVSTNINSYIENKQKEGISDDVAKVMFYFEECYHYYKDYKQEQLLLLFYNGDLTNPYQSPHYYSLNNNPLDDKVDLVKYLSFLESTNSVTMTSQYLYHMYMFKQDYGYYPESSDPLYMTEYTKNSNEYSSIFHYIIEESQKDFDYSIYDIYNIKPIVMNKEDYENIHKNLCYFSDDYLSEQFHSSSYDDIKYYSHYLMIHSTLPQDTFNYLINKYEDILISPESLIESKGDIVFDSLISSIILLVITISILGICIYFIMKANFMSNIKEIGIYRAIGVKKKNIVFRYMIESIVLTTLSTFIGYLISSILINYVQKQSFFSEFFYYPLWMALLLLVIIYGFFILFGTLPVLSLLRKTPSKILSKYDI